MHVPAVGCRSFVVASSGVRGCVTSNDPAHQEVPAWETRSVPAGIPQLMDSHRSQPATHAWPVQASALQPPSPRAIKPGSWNPCDAIPVRRQPHIARVRLAMTTSTATAAVGPVPQDGQMASPQPETWAAIDAVREATSRLQAAVDQAIEIGGASTMAAPSRLPDWTIGHVVSHLARNADGLRRVLLAAQSSQQIEPYDSPQARANDIQAGAQRDTETIADDLRTADQQLFSTIDGLGAATWEFTVDLGRGGPTTADVILAARLGEVELHHHDLGVDDGLDLLDDAQASRLLAALMRSYVRTRDVNGITLVPDGTEVIRIRGGGQEVAGTSIELVRWLSGRSNGSGLRTVGTLPPLPTW